MTSIGLCLKKLVLHFSLVASDNKAVKVNVITAANRESAQWKSEIVDEKIGNKFLSCNI